MFATSKKKQRGCRPIQQYTKITVGGGAMVAMVTAGLSRSVAMSGSRYHRFPGFASFCVNSDMTENFEKLNRFFHKKLWQCGLLPRCTNYIFKFAVPKWRFYVTQGQINILLFHLPPVDPRADSNSLQQRLACAVIFLGAIKVGYPDSPPVL